MNPEERNGRIGSRDHAQERKQHRAEMRVAKEQERKRKYEEEIVAKASDGQRYPMPLSKCWFELEGERGSGPEGVADVHIDRIVCPVNCNALFL